MSPLWNHPSVSPCSSRICSDASPTVMRPIPIPSMRRNPCARIQGGSVTNRRPRKTASTPIGRFTKKIHGHERLSVSHPPSVGPIAGPSSMTIPNRPIAWPCSSGGNVSRAIAWVVGDSTPPPIPWRTRNRINWPSVRESPHNSDAAVKIAIAIRYMRFRPRIDPSHVVRGMMITSAIRYEVLTQVTCCVVTPYVAWMWTRATFTTLESIAPITAPAMTDRTTTHLLGPAARSRLAAALMTPACADIRRSLSVGRRASRRGRACTPRRYSVSPSCARRASAPPPGARISNLSLRLTTGEGARLPAATIGILGGGASARFGNDVILSGEGRRCQGSRRRCRAPWR